MLLTYASKNSRILTSQYNVTKLLDLRFVFYKIYKWQVQTDLYPGQLLWPIELISMSQESIFMAFNLCIVFKNSLVSLFAF